MFMLESSDLTAFLAFLDKIKEKGEINPTTAQARKTACEAAIKMVGDEDPRTVEWVRDHLDDLMRRLMNKNSRLTSRSAQTYKSRIIGAISDFLAYQQDPVGWRPKSSKRGPQVDARKSADPKFTAKRNGAHEERPGSRSFDQSEASDFTTYRFPLRPGHTIEIRNVPNDLKIEEVWRFACFVATLAQDFRPTGGSLFGEMVVAKS